MFYRTAAIPVTYRVTLKLIRLLQTLSSDIFRTLRSSWQDFNPHHAVLSDSWPSPLVFFILFHLLWLCHSIYDFKAASQL